MPYSASPTPPYLEIIRRLTDNVHQAVVIDPDQLSLILAALLARGHVLLEDVPGSAIYDPREQRFRFVPGPVFANVVLVDEINRASPRTQSSLLECMAECQVTSDGFTYPLEQPFFVIATQNPVEVRGTFPLPEAQLDRFLVMLNLGYPQFNDEVTILEERNTPIR